MGNYEHTLRLNYLVATHSSSLILYKKAMGQSGLLVDNNRDLGEACIHVVRPLVRDWKHINDTGCNGNYTVKINDYFTTDSHS